MMKAYRAKTSTTLMKKGWDGLPSTYMHNIVGFIAKGDIIHVVSQHPLPGCLDVTCHLIIHKDSIGEVQIHGHNPDFSAYFEELREEEEEI